MRDNWISINDKLPDKKQEVTVAKLQNGVYISMNALWDNGFQFFGHADNSYRWMIFNLSNVTHWMPLPEPPKP